MSRPIDIVVDARMLLPYQTGVGSYLMGLASGLCSSPGNHQVEFWLQAGLPVDHPVWSLGNERLILRRSTISHMSLSQHWVIPAELRRRKPDLFHYPHFDLPWGVPGPVIATIHDLKYIARPDFFPRMGKTKRLVMLAMMRHTVRRAQRVIAVSESTRRDVIGWLGAEPERVRVISEGVDPIYFERSTQVELDCLLERYRLAQPYFLFVGERRPHKNLVGLLNAYQDFCRSISRPYLLVIAGKRYAEYTEPERLAEELGVSQSVRFLEYVPQADLPLLYQGAEAFILLSHYEGFGIPVLEAMASGVPVVVARNTALPEVVGEAGLQVPADEPQEVAEALRRLTSGDSLRQDFIYRGLARAQQFNWVRCARETLALYQEVADR
jgi:glycosyltransferase involved in cell wall biosynthesis